MPGGLFFDGVHIHCCGNGHLWFRSYSESLWKSPKVTKGLLPRHSVPRLGSACPHSGIAPGARRHRPSMAGGGYRGIPAAVPPAQRLRSASGKGAADQDQDQKPKPKPKQRQDQQLREQARSHSWTGYIRKKIGQLTDRHRSDAATRQASSDNGTAYQGAFSPLYRPSVSSPAAFDLDAPPPREAEWRFCAVGNPAWMPG